MSSSAQIQSEINSLIEQISANPFGNIDALLNQISQLEIQLTQLEEAEKNEANNQQPDTSKPPDTTNPTDDPTTLPINDGSGMRHDAGNGYTYEYNTGGDPSKYGITFGVYDKDGNKVFGQNNVKPDAFGDNLEDIKATMQEWTEGQLISRGFVDAPLPKGWAKDDFGTYWENDDNGWRFYNGSVSGGGNWVYAAPQDDNWKWSEGLGWFWNNPEETGGTDMFWSNDGQAWFGINAEGSMFDPYTREFIDTLDEIEQMNFPDTSVPNEQDTNETNNEQDSSETNNEQDSTNYNTDSSLQIGDKTLDFSLGNQNKAFSELDETIEGLKDTASSEDSTDEEKEQALSLLNQIDEQLVEGAKNLEKVSTEIKDQMEATHLELVELNNEYATTEDPQKQNQLLRAINARQTKLNSLEFSHNKNIELANAFQNEVKQDLANGENEQDVLDKAIKYTTFGALALSGLASGYSLFERFFGDEDSLEGKSTSEQMSDYIDAVDQNMGEMINTQKKYQPELTELGQLDKYQQMFGGAPFGELYDKYNEELGLDNLYNQYLLGPDGLPNSGDEPGDNLSKEDWFKQWMDDNPDSSVSKEYTYNISQLGQEEKLLSGKLDTASNIFKPKSQGGMGYTQDMFRTKEQQKVMGIADDLMGSGLSQTLGDSIRSELEKGGEHSDAYYGAQRDRILGGLAPSLAKQGGLLSGGVQRLAREMTGDNERTLLNRQNQASNYLGNQTNQLTSLSNLVNANTMSPTGMVGLGQGGQLINQYYNQAGQGYGNLLADPTTGHAGASGQQDNLLSLFSQANQPSTSEIISGTANDVGNIADTLKYLQDLNKG